ncbi:MAG: hypothetical protein ACLTDR_00050 [Adlercreutzia equolifaciens]
MRQYVNFQDDRAKIPLLVEARSTAFDYLVVGERARVARAGEEPHQPARAVLQRRLQGRQELPLHRAHERRCVPGHQVHARETPVRTQVLRSLHRQPRRPGHGGHRPACSALCAATVRRLAPAQAPFGEGPARSHVARRPPVLRRARGPGPRRLLRGHHARGVPRPERAAHRALPRQASTASSSTSCTAGNAGGRRRAGLRARATRIKARIDTIS